MFSSVAKYLWGDSDDVEQDYKAASEMKEAEGNLEDFDLHHDEDWLVVGQSALNQSSDNPVEVEPKEEPSNQAEQSEARLPTVDECRREIQHRHWGVPTVSPTTPEQIIKQINIAQRAQTVLTNKALSGQRCRQENRVYDKSYCKNKTRRSKNVRPAGFKAGRLSQRV